MLCYLVLEYHRVYFKDVNKYADEVGRLLTDGCLQEDVDGSSLTVRVGTSHKKQLDDS